MRDLAKFYSSWVATEDLEGWHRSSPLDNRTTLIAGGLVALPVLRMIVQTLANLVTANEGLMTTMWECYMNLPEDELILLYDKFTSIYVSDVYVAYLTGGCWVCATLPRSCPLWC